MKKILTNLLSASDSNIKFAKSIVLGSLLAFFVGYTTVEIHYYSITPTGKKISISLDKYESSSYKFQERFIKKTNYNTLFILIGLVSGTAIGYLLIKEKK